MCLNPTLIKNKKYKPNKKNNGNVPMVKDERTLYVPVGCGYCSECRNQKANSWKIRLQKECEGLGGLFFTFSLSDEAIEELNDKDINYDANLIATKAVRRYLERIRKKTGKSVRHWLVTELGENNTERIHIHGIIWSHKEAVLNKWGYGNIKVKQFWGDRTINYIVKYMMKTPEKHPEYIPKVLCSKGIGKSYLESQDAKKNKFKGCAGLDTNETVRLRNGKKIGLPIYYRNKIYSEEEREELWLNKLDEQKRWIKGVQIDVSKNEETYEKARAYYAAIDKRNGYIELPFSEQRKKKSYKAAKKYEKYLQEIKRLTKIANDNKQKPVHNINYKTNGTKK